MSSPKILNRETIESLVLKYLPDIKVGFAKLERPLSMNYYDQFLKEGLQGDLDYLSRHRDFKEAPQKWLPMAQSAISMTFHYVTERNIKPLKGKRVSFYTTYARDGEDYHFQIKRRLSPVIKALENAYPNDFFRLTLDAEPVLERDLAYRARLGWIGKNSFLLDRNRGSLFFIGEILTSLILEDNIETLKAAHVLNTDFCGTCTKCIDACPTRAILSPKHVDPRLCIPYWTIESKKIAPKELRKKFGDWFFGCDICQVVCPWNGKVFGHPEMKAHAHAVLPRKLDERNILIEEFREILTASHGELERRYHNSPLKRARGWGLKRNALYVISNLHLHELAEEVGRLRSDPRLGELATDVYNEITTATAQRI